MLPLEPVFEAPRRRYAARYVGCAERLQAGVAVLLLMYTRALLHAGGGLLVHADVAKIVRIAARASRKMPPRVAIQSDFHPLPPFPPHSRPVVIPSPPLYHP